MKNISLLLAAQLLSVSGTVMIVMLGGIVGMQLSGNAAIATLPMSLMVIGTAAATVLAAWLMSRIGRRLGFLCGALIAAVAASLAALSIAHHSFVAFCIAVGLYGVNGAFVQQYRFAATECVPVERAAVAVSTILVGSIGGAIIGPWLATAGAHWFADEFVGSMLAIAVLQVCAAAVLSALNMPLGASAARSAQSTRGVAQLFVQGGFLLAVIAGVVGNSTMTLVMTATPLSMHVHDAFSLEDTAWVIRSHVMAMYLPSLFSGWLVSQLGARRMMAVGVVCIASTVGVGFLGHHLMHYWVALVMLGLGWNLLFVGGTAELVRHYTPDERFRAQAVNEFSVFGASALASLSAGWVLNALGWEALLTVAIVPLVLMLGLLATTRREVVAA